MSASLPVSGHTNLSALQIIGSCVSSLLGPIKGVKCLFDEEINEGVLVTSTNELLQGLDIEHPVGQLVREFCLSQHKRHGSGCTTLVTLAGLWAANVQSLLNQDVPIQDIIRVGDEFLQGCGDIAEQSAISIPSLSKAAAVTIEREEERDRMMLYTSTSLQSSSAEQPIHHGIVMRSEVKETHSVSLNQNSNNSCALLSQTPFQSTTPAGSNHHERWKHAGASGIESSNSSLVKKQARTVLSASSAKIDTSSAILKEDDVDDVSWFFENDSQYSDKVWDTDSIATGNLAGKRDEVSLHGCEQKDSSCVEKAVAEQDDEDVEWFFEDNHIFSDAVSHHDDHQTTISSSMHEEKGKDVSLEVTDSKESKERFKTGESISQPRHEQPHLKTVQDQEKSEQMVCRKDVHSVLEQSHKVPTKENSFTRTSSVKSSERLESLLKSAIEQKPSKLQKGSRRILSRHLLDDKQDMCALSMASETPVRESTLKMTSNDLGQSRKKDEKAAVLPTLTQNETSSDHVLTQDVGKSFRMHMQNVDVTGILADDVIRTEETTLKEQLPSEIETLGDSLNHGAVAEMELAIEACQAQMMASQDPQRFDFNTDLVHIQTLTGPSSLSSCCIHGLVLTVLENQLNTLHAVTGRRMVALLINSDLQESYRHRGFKDSLKSSSIVSVIPTMGTSPNSVWSERVLSSLNKLNVNLLLVRGSVDSSLVDACCFHDILILEHVPYRLLQLLGTVHKSNLLAYIPDALQDDVCDNIKVSYWWSSGYDPHPTVRSRGLKIQHHVRIVCPGNVMTIILCAPSEPHLTGAEQRLHSCMARLRGALHDGKVLPGGGRMEQCIVEKLTKEDEHVTDFHPYRRGLVYEALAQGFGAYTQHTHLNTGQCQAIEDASPDAASCHSSPSSNVHDCFLAKKGAWQRAWHLVKQVLLCDALIITGVDKGDKDLHRVL